MKRWIIVLASALLGIYPIANSFGHPEVPSAQPVMQRTLTKVPIKHFTLTDQTGTPFEFNKLAGKVVIAGFGYTTCPDICPLITAAMRTVQERLTAAEKGSVYFLTITTDPEVDSPSVLNAYARRYKVSFSNWSFLAGDERELKVVWQNFGVKVKRKARGLIDHTALTGVIDQGGMLRVAYHGTAPDPTMMLQDVRSFLRAKSGH